MDKIDEVLTRGVDKIYPNKESLEKVLHGGKKIRLYQGFDPTGPYLHIGHAVALRKLRQFQELGHDVIFLIGDFTARIGDPTGKLDTRKFLTESEVLENAKQYKIQAGKILDFGGENPVEVKYNSEWLGKMSSIDFFNLTRNLTLQQVIERDMFQNRIKNRNDIYVNELLYPFMQGYDSIAMNVDLEVGGSDQTFNMLMGRKLMRNVLKKEKFVMTVPLLTDSKGTKIGKSEDNIIGLTDKPADFYAKIMALSDNSIANCFTLLTDKPEDEIKKIETAIKGGENPMKYKKMLAFELTSWLNTKKEAENAQENFERTFQERRPTFDIKVSSGNTLASTIAPFTSLASISDAKRLIRQGAVDVHGRTVTDSSIKVKIGDEIKVGERTFLKVTK